MTDADMLIGITEKKIYEYASENSLIAGIGSAESFPLMRTLPSAPFAEPDKEKRAEPSLTVENAQSIVALGLFYNKVYRREMDNKLRGRISIGAVGEDYHSVLLRHLNALMEYADISGKCFADTGPLSDRAAALRCGLGYVGRHGSIINEEFGSFFFIGYIITPERLIPSPSPKTLSCDGCLLCIKNCPAKALTAGGFDYRRCISYLTQSKELDPASIKLIGTNIYGCDICQKICPRNKKTPETIEDISLVYPEIEELIKMTNSGFRERFAHTAAGWRGKKIIQRNALIAALNSNHPDKYKIIEMCRNDERKEIKEVLKWAGIQED